MHVQERKNILFRIIAVLLLFVSVGLVIFIFFQVFTFNPEGKIIDIVALISLALFCSFEMFLLIKGGVKESNLQKIAFEEKGRVNQMGIVIVLIGTLFGLTLTVLCTTLYFIKEDITAKINSLIILAIGLYLLINCIIYFIYLLMFRKREVSLIDLSK